MTLLDVRFSDWIQKGFQLFFANALLLILCGVVAAAISVATLGLLSGTMIAGMAVIILNLMDNRLAKPTINELFKGFDYFKDTLPVTLAFYGLAALSYVLGYLPLIGRITSSVVASVGSSLAILTIFHLVARRQPPVKTARAWIDIFKVNWGPLLGFFILSSIIGGAGVLLLGIGLVVTVPVHLCILGIAYVAISAQTAAV